MRFGVYDVKSRRCSNPFVEPTSIQQALNRSGRSINTNYYHKMTYCKNQRALRPRVPNAERPPRPRLKVTTRTAQISPSFRPPRADFLSRWPVVLTSCRDLHFSLARRRLDVSAPAPQQCVAWLDRLDGDQRLSFRLSPRQRSFNWQSTAFVMRGLWVRLPPLALSRSRGHQA